MRPLLKKAGFSGLWYLLGCATPFVVAMVCNALEVGPLPWQAVNRWKRWNVDEEQPGHLVIHSWREGEWSAGIWRDPTTDEMESVSFRGPPPIDAAEGEGVGITFDYRTQGGMGEPIALYSGGRTTADWVIWVDYNADGRFDKRSSFREGKLEVLLSGQWVQAHGSDSDTDTMVTEDGVEIAFDVKSGEWKPVAPAGTPTEP